MKYLGVDLLNLYGRFTTSVGRGLTRVMASKVGGKSISKVYRTAPDGTKVMLKTMNGMPRITGSAKVACDVTVSASTPAEEGDYLIHTVTLTNPTTASRRFAVSFKDITAVDGTNYVAVPSPNQDTPDSGVTFSGNFVTLASGRYEFEIWIEMLSPGDVDTTYRITVGCASGIGTIPAGDV